METESRPMLALHGPDCACAPCCDEAAGAEVNAEAADIGRTWEDAARAPRPHCRYCAEAVYSIESHKGQCPVYRASLAHPECSECQTGSAHTPHMPLQDAISWRCECEHKSHNDGSHHSYGAHVLREEDMADRSVLVKTDYGTFRMCRPCRAEHAIYATCPDCGFQFTAGLIVTVSDSLAGWLERQGMTDQWFSDGYEAQNALNRALNIGTAIYPSENPL